MKHLIVTRKQIVIFLFTLVALVVACTSGAAVPPQDTPSPPDDDHVGLANPASVYCEEQGGRLEIRSDAEGNQHGVCVFEDGSECEEWAFFWGECQPGESENSSTNDEVKLSDQLDGTGWELVEIAGDTPLADTTITIEFAGEEFSGSAGCNGYFGSYSTEGSQFTVGMIGNTEMWCDGLMDQEQAYLALLGAAESAKYDKGILTIHAGEGDLIFRATSKSDISEELLAHVWQWQAYEDNAEINDILVDDPTRYTLEFLSDGTYQIRADCNQGSGGYTVDGSSVTFGPGPMTMAACGPDSLDSEFLRGLGDVVTYLLADGKLFLNLKMDAGNMIFEAK